MVTSPGGKGVIIIGEFNWDESKHSNALLELKGPSWIPLKQKLQHARTAHVAIPIPVDWTIPNTNKVTTQKQKPDRKRKDPKQLMLNKVTKQKK